MCGDLLAGWRVSGETVRPFELAKSRDINMCLYVCVSVSAFMEFLRFGWPFLGGWLAGCREKRRVSVNTEPDPVAGQTRVGSGINRISSSVFACFLFSCFVQIVVGFVVVRSLAASTSFVWIAAPIILTQPNPQLLALIWLMYCAIEVNRRREGRHYQCMRGYLSHTIRKLTRPSNVLLDVGCSVGCNGVSGICIRAAWCYCSC